MCFWLPQVLLAEPPGRRHTRNLLPDGGQVGMFNNRDCTSAGINFNGNDTTICFSDAQGANHKDLRKLYNPKSQKHFLQRFRHGEVCDLQTYRVMSIRSIVAMLHFRNTNRYYCRKFGLQPPCLCCALFSKVPQRHQI
jgi:hypothetical protein